MIRRIVVLLIVLVSGAWTAHAADWIPLTSRLATQVPRVEMQRGTSDAIGVCSAVVFYIDVDGMAHALGAAHCVDHAPTESFDLTLDGRNAKAVMFNRIFDLAIIQFRPKTGTSNMLFAPSSPPAGTEIAVAGYAFGVDGIVYQFGHIAQPYNRETKAIWIDARIIFGDSGGALVDNLGRLVGISTRIFAQGPANLGGAVPIETVRDFVDDYRAWLKDEAKKSR